MPFTKSTAEITADSIPYFAFNVGIEGFLPPPHGQIKLPAFLPSASREILTGCDLRISLEPSIRSINNRVVFSASGVTAFGSTSATAAPLTSCGGTHFIC